MVTAYAGRRNEAGTDHHSNQQKLRTMSTSHLSITAAIPCHSSHFDLLFQLFFAPASMAMEDLCGVRRVLPAPPGDTLISPHHVPAEARCAQPASVTSEDSELEMILALSGQQDLRAWLACGGNRALSWCERRRAPQPRRRSVSLDVHLDHQDHKGFHFWQ